MRPAWIDRTTRSMSGKCVSMRTHRHVREQRVDVLVVAVLSRPEEVQVLPVADARHQIDAEQVGQAEDRRRLALGVGVEGVGLDRPTGSR